MESEPLHVVREGLERFNAGDYDGAIGLLADEIEWDTSGAVPDGALYAGRDAVLGLWREIGERWDDFRIVGERWFDGDGVVLMLGRLEARGAGSGVPVASRWDQVWRIRDGTPIRCENYTDRERAVRASGLEPEGLG